MSYNSKVQNLHFGVCFFALCNALWDKLGAMSIPKGVLWYIVCEIMVLYK